MPASTTQTLLPISFGLSQTGDRFLVAVPVMRGRCVRSGSSARYGLVSALNGVPSLQLTSSQLSHGLRRYSSTARHKCGSPPTRPALALRKQMADPACCTHRVRIATACVAVGGRRRRRSNGRWPRGAGNGSGTRICGSAHRTESGSPAACSTCEIDYARTQRFDNRNS